MLRASVIVFPGSNCDRDVKTALEAITGFPVKMVWHGDASVPVSDVIVLPGGFSYGDYLRCGAMAAHSPIMRDVIAKAKAGTPVIGICNGFQILCEVGTASGRADAQRVAALHLPRRASQGRERHQLLLQLLPQGRGHSRARSRMRRTLSSPIAETLDRLEGEGQVVFRYSDKDGNVSAETCPNGAQRNIAGITDATGRVLGMMPHPERLYRRRSAARTAGACSRARWSARLPLLRKRDSSYDSSQRKRERT